MMSLNASSSSSSSLSKFFLLYIFTFTLLAQSRADAQQQDQQQRIRTARSPDSERIQRWKLAFSGDLTPLPQVLNTVTCNWALHELCLKHISCRELWTLFRRNCVVDAQNNCQMPNKNDCWQSFEGISWTGLGSCTCPGNNSDCHWIRLQTNYNKCVYLLGHDANWHAALNSAAQYAIRANGRGGGGRNQNQSSIEQHPSWRRRSGEEAGVEQWRAEQQWHWHKGQGRSRETEVEEEQKRKISEEEEGRRRSREEEEERKKRVKEEEEGRRRSREEEEERRRRIEEEEEKRRKVEEEERKRRVKEEEEGRIRKLKEEEEEMERRRMKAREERMKRIRAEEDRKRRRKEKEEEEEQRRKEEEDDERRRKEVEERKRRKELEAEERRSTRRKVEEEEKQRLERINERRKLMELEMRRSRKQAQEEEEEEEQKRRRMNSVTASAHSAASNEEKQQRTSTEAVSGEAGAVHSVQLNTGPEDVVYYTEGRRTTPSRSGGRNGTATIWSSTAGTTRQATTTPLPLNSTVRVVPTEAQRLVTQAEPPPTSPAPKANGTEAILEQQQMNVQRDAVGDGGPIPAGTCPEVLAICERDESACKWHLSELLIKCPAAFSNNTCQRSAQCSAAISRFVRFVPAPLAEAMLFCTPDGTGVYGIPPVLRYRPSNCSSPSPEKKPKARWSCTQTAQMCRAEPSCNRRLSTLRTACPPSNSSSSSTSPSPCAAPSLAKCRSALASIRGTWLDEPCHCSTRRGLKAVEECQKWERTLWPGNPCIAPVRDDFNELFLADQLQIEPSPRPTPKPPATSSASTRRTTSTARKQSMPGMDLGEEVTLLPGEEEEEEEKQQEEEEEKKPLEKPRPNQTGAQRMGSRDRKKGTSKPVAKTAPSSTTSTSSTTTTTTTTSSTLYAEELVGRLDDGEEEEEMQAKMQIEPVEKLLAEGSRLSYELASSGVDEEDKNETTTDWRGISTRRPKPEEDEPQMATTGRMPLPEFDFVTQKPPSKGDGCRTRNIDGEWVQHYPDSVFRHFHDWAGRCSSWCECKSGNSTAKCHPLGCLSDVLCEARHTTVAFGQRLYLEDRGACQCHDGRFICDSSELRPDLGPGLYLSLGYSKSELEMIREKVPRQILERSGIISQTSSLVKDLATRLQFALERVLPEGIKCRVAVLEHFPPEQVVLMQLQWFGVDPSINNSRAKWHSGKMEKHCSPFVRELELTFLLEKADRYQLLLSTIKQIRVIDLLDALPLHSAQMRGAESLPPLILLILAMSLLITCPFDDSAPPWSRYIRRNRYR